jgi:starch synthase
MAAPEAVPYVKTGGLADVVGSLPRALRRKGAEVSVVLPAYGTIDRDRFGLQPAEFQIAAPVSNRLVTAGVLRGEAEDGVRAYFIDAPQYFARDGVYGTPRGDYPDNAERFAFFSRAVLGLLLRLGPPDVLHCHDWQSALALAFLRADQARYRGLEGVRTVHTVHNVGYQGIFWRFDWHLLNLDGRYYTPDFLEFYDNINYLKAGLVFADAITTVSPTYALEIQTPALGYGLEGVLAARRDALVGILNGVDYHEWNPETDGLIAARYSAEALDGKALCKADLQSAVALPVDPAVPVLGVVSRLADQKGFDLLVTLAPAVLQWPLQIVILGSGDGRYQDRLQELARMHPARLAVRVGFDNTLAHKIEAGSDVFLMPSRYEPCGLSQIYSLRYGTIPVVHATGGLEDTITDFDPATGCGNGFKFRAYTTDAFAACIARALQTYATPQVWRTLIRHAMGADFSWERSADHYLALYERLHAPG